MMSSPKHVFVSAPNLVMLRGYSLLYTEELLLTVLWGPDGAPGIDLTWISYMQRKCPTSCTITVASKIYITVYERYLELKGLNTDWITCKPLGILSLFVSTYRLMRRIKNALLLVYVVFLFNIKHSF